MKQKHMKCLLRAEASPRRFWRGLAIAVLATFVFSFGFFNGGLGSLLRAKAATPGSVVINEVAWAGSADSSTDEWIELYNNSNQAVDLTNWSINDNHGAYIYKILSGTIAAHGYFLVEDHETTVNTVTADAIINITLSNSGQSLELFDANNNSMDVVNSSAGAWFAGSAVTKASMERIDSVTSGDLASNWASSTGAGDTSSSGSAIIGTPKRVNSAQKIDPVFGQKIELSLDSQTPYVGDLLNVTFKITNAQDLFAYGFDLTYDPAILHFKSAAIKPFLSQNGQVQTSFQSALENGTEGKLVLAEARTNAVKMGISGSGDLLTVQFDVVSGNGVASALHFEPKSFVANPTQDTAAQFTDQNFTPKNKQIAVVTNLKAAEGVDRYSLQLNWDAVPGATGYRVLRKDAHSQWVSLGEIAQTTFVDKDGVTKGGLIIPGHEYHYQVLALNGQIVSLPVEIIQKDVRGLTGDNDRSDRVDGRDLEKLAKHFGEADADQNFDALTDTTYDGQIDGSDLIDIGAQFAKTYKP